MTVRSFRELVERRGDELTDRIFITAPETGVSLTFGRYRRAVMQFAALLEGKGVERGERVAVVLSNGLNAAIAMLGVMSAGGVAVPVNPKLKGPEIAWLLNHSGARLVVTDLLHQSSLAGAGLGDKPATVDGCEKDNPYALYPVSRFEAKRAGQGDRLLPARDDTAMILYTSGTTGHPKGVILSHGNLLSNAGHVSEAHRLTSADVALCVLPLFHINGFVFTLLAPLLSGSAVVMPGRFHVERFWHWVRDHRVTWFSAVPTILSLLLSHAGPAPADIESVRFARSASAPLPVAVLEEFEHRFGIPVIETYGISEAAGQVTANPLPPLVRKPGSAGLPAGNELAVVDEDGSRLPAGSLGEVVLRGDNIFCGYLANPEADREALQEVWYHTGDLGYLDEDGYVFLTGRKKELINRSGEKISPREVEEIIHRLPEVEEVGVVGLPHRLYGEEVAAFVMLRQGRYLEAETVRQFCRKHLAGFKVPREVLFIDEFPKGPSGKIQRRRLVDVYQQITSLQEKEKRA